MRHNLELLSPAANADIAIQAIMHGADAVYIGASSHGARKNAANTLDEIARVVDFAHRFRARVYVTVNTIVYDREVRIVERLCRDLYHIGVDALIVQDMGLLRMSLPPIALHASTQCDIRTPEKARFLQEVGFSQLVLARELTLGEIRLIAESVDVPVECFVHGALCVSYSGKCHASCATTGRSANRGECSQVCRLPYTLTDDTGKILCRDRYLLSLKDFNASDSIPDLIESGVSSFKIEGRLKEMDYVKNVTSWYDNLLNEYIEGHRQYCRSSYGEVSRSFVPKPDKSFNRGFTDYFLTNRRPTTIASLLTPKSMGEKIEGISMINNGDGVSYINSRGVYSGVKVNKVDGGKLLTNRKVDIPKGVQLHRTYDAEWQKVMARPSADRRIRLHIAVDEKGVTAQDERGVMVRLPLAVTMDVARKSMDYESEFAKLGNTHYVLESYHSTLDPMVFIPRSEVAALRRNLVSLLDWSNLSTYRVDCRRQENRDIRYPLSNLDFRENVSNALAYRFYKDHGVDNIEMAMETDSRVVRMGTQVMNTRHCILRELGMCKRRVRDTFVEPLRISDGTNRYRLGFDCRDCEMRVYFDTE
ncbi:MAG: U32 family peptidase [Muribaculaceae bacterium]|nr:U32 family peptidase [Muribaculaceae bacterium]